MPRSLADRLRLAGHRRFVGRGDECRLFDEALGADLLPFSVLHVHGPGGIGKTTLLREFAYRCEARGVDAHYADARAVEGGPPGLLAALGAALGVPGDQVTGVLGGAEQRRVILLDTFEAVAALERWLYTSLLPHISEHVLLVIAGRHPPQSAAFPDPAWRALVRAMPLRNLSPDESRAYLTATGLPPERHDAALAFTHGHPLALTLTAEVLEQRRDADLTAASPDVIKALLDRFVMSVPSPAHRTALEVCALVRHTSEALLASVLDVPDAHDLFEWLRGLSFMEAGPSGLSPHDLAREVLCADLQWRNPEWYRTLHARARRFYTARLRGADAGAHHRLLSDYVFLQRDVPVVRPFFDRLRKQWAEHEAPLLEDAATDDDWPALEAMVAAHEGAEAAVIAARWFRRQPQHVTVYRREDGSPAGFLLALALHEASESDVAADPATAAASRYLAAHAPLRTGEGATLFRFWMDADRHQAISPVQSLIFIRTVRHYLSTPGLAFTFLPCADPGFWALIFAFVHLQRIPEAAFELSGREYGVYGHDWRQTPPAAWLDALAERAGRTDSTDTPPERELLVVLSREAFVYALRDALRSYARPTELQHNPLLQSRIVLEDLAPGADVPDRIEVLRRLLRDAAGTLADAPRESKYHRALERAYFRPAPTQEAAADLLGLPYSTFRRHLTRGVDAVTDLLWQREIGQAGLLS